MRDAPRSASRAAHRRAEAHHALRARCRWLRCAGARAVTAALGIACAAPAGVIAAAPLRAPHEASLRLGVTARSWTLSRSGAADQEIDQVAFPIVARAPVAGDALRVSVSASGALSEVRAAETASLDAPADTRVRLTYHPRESSILISAGAGLPTGKTELTEEEAVVSRAVSNQVLGFPANRTGEGLDLFGSVYLARSVGSAWSAGGGAAFTRKGEFDYALRSAAGPSDVDPGDELAFTIGASRVRRDDESAAASTIDIDATLRTFGSDAVAGREVFQEGTEIVLTGRAARDGERTRWSARASGVVKTDNELLGGAAAWSAPDASQSFLLSNVMGSGARFDAAVSRRFTAHWDAGLALGFERFGSVTIDSAVASAGGGARGAASAFEAGPTLAWRASPRFALDAAVLWLSGSAEEGDVDLSGFELRIGSELRP